MLTASLLPEILQQIVKGSDEQVAGMMEINA